MKSMGCVSQISVAKWSAFTLDNGLLSKVNDGGCHTVNKCLRYGSYGQTWEYVALYVTLKIAAGVKAVIRQNVANDQKRFTAHQESEPRKKLP